jgi:hypothetical protein
MLTTEPLFFDQSDISNVEFFFSVSANAIFAYSEIQREFSGVV